MGVPVLVDSASVVPPSIAQQGPSAIELRGPAHFEMRSPPVSALGSYLRMAKHGGIARHGPHTVQAVEVL